MEPVRFGILGNAKIARTQVIPALKQSPYCTPVAIASRNKESSQAAALEMGLEQAFGGYDELLADPDIEAVYIPLPNHLHLPYCLRALSAGKHVLCEKPIGLDTEQVETLISAQKKHGLVLQEAFMVRVHPQWLRVKELIQQGAIGDVRTVNITFSYYNRDPQNVRNQPGIGGGALLDVGCYGSYLSRFVFDDEPLRVVSLMEQDSDFGVDCLTSALMEFPKGQAFFSCGTQLVPTQKASIQGTKGRIEIEIPFNPYAEQPARLWLDDGSRLGNQAAEKILLDPVNQYRLQADQFALAVRQGTPPAVSLEDSLANAKVLDAIIRSAQSNSWQNI
ncbi:Gfo/Idh/MocA family protein [Motiliproteus sp. MSK22-1]|uniref:Gfo/Idh/MocA family protein n=1 Tax=Motiliproteus sp. MSK22-1 TaxID=1897630 RepID=UPI00097698FE|nr:Gfo/Idh/MocA family oxidoreductase [Motiliproteus sp. MSK22-1]OMH25829.1 NAD-binding protein [Motiliproteus sp. MSK22-1]